MSCGVVSAPCTTNNSAMIRPRYLLRIRGSLLICVAVAGCASAPRAPVPNPTSATSDGLPAIDTAIQPVSASSPSLGAQHALDACGLTSYDPTHPGTMVFGDLGLKVVTGIGLIPAARDAGKYAPIGLPPGIDPELNNSSPAWVITTNASISTGLSPGLLINPTCVVPDGARTGAMWFVTGDTIDGSVIETPAPEPSPVMRLPPLAP